MLIRQQLKKPVWTIFSDITEKISNALDAGNMDIITQFVLYNSFVSIAYRMIIIYKTALKRTFVLYVLGLGI